jgi:NAD(P)-dependent dehydrogenase (short-subunit alcohol dehydrogenase family)
MTFFARNPESNLSMIEKFKLDGKTALVTGGAGLLGIEHAVALLETGAVVVISDIDEGRLGQALDQISLRTGSERIHNIRMDVTKKTDIENAAEILTAKGLEIDILVNNAAVDPKVDSKEGLLNESRFENFSLEQWDFQLNVGLTGAFLCSQVMGTRMSRTGKGGVILNIASDLSVFSPDQRIYRKKGLADEQQPVKPVTYSVIKTGLLGLTRYLATYWVEQGVRCNALSPGGVYTGQDEDFVQKLTSLIPMGRMASKDEYHSAVQFLCSDASAYLNGQNIVMDGGRSVW